MNHESTIELFLQKKNKLVNVVNSRYVTIENKDEYLIIIKLYNVFFFKTLNNTYIYFFQDILFIFHHALYSITVSISTLYNLQITTIL